MLSTDQAKVGYTVRVRRMYVHRSIPLGVREHCTVRQAAGGRYRAIQPRTGCAITREVNSRSTSRLRWRPLRRGDESVFRALCTDEHIRGYLLDGAVVSTGWVWSEVERSAQRERCGGIGIGLVHEADGAAPIGFAGFRVFEEHHPEPQLVYALLKPFTGRGYASELARMLIGLAREKGEALIHAAVDEPNLASIRVLEKLGFVRWNAWPGAFGRTDGFVLGASVALTVGCAWNGGEAAVRERANVDVRFELDRVILDVRATHHGDPAPGSPPGPTDKLWEHEVVELFLLGDDARYLELELGPHGHHLVLALHGPRRIERKGMELDYHVSVAGGVWKGRAIVPAQWLPPGLRRVNAYAIHGAGSHRRYLACFPVPGAAPDFHRLGAFGSLTALVQCGLGAAGGSARST